jgi:hypothetical protein
MPFWPKLPSGQSNEFSDLADRNSQPVNTLGALC